mgnify:FL=1
MIKVFLTILLFCACESVNAQTDRFKYADSSLLNELEKTEETAESDTTLTETEIIEETRDILSDTTLYINPIAVPDDSIKALKADPRFNYIKNLDSLLNQKQKQEPDPDPAKNSGKRSFTFLYKILNSGILKIIFWGIAISFMLFILYRLFLSNGIFRRNTRALPANEQEITEETLSVSDHDKRIQQAYQQGNYRLAVRYWFLKNLANLSDKDYLQLSPDKTNYQYVQEITAGKKNEFAALVLTYEYVWYGNFSLTEESYLSIEKKYNSFFQKI